MVKTDQGYFRIFPFVAGSHSLDVLETPGQAYEAAAQFGTFTRLLKRVDVNRLKMTIPRFHDLSLRYEQFTNATKQGNKQRVAESKSLINKVEHYSGIVETFKKIPSNKAWRLRVTHHDTKISNVLFNSVDKGICVIDLDTLMPGYFISDVGDMMRTYLSPVSEEEKDVEKIQVRDAFYRAIVSGYYEQMKEELTETERKHFFYAGKFMIYMQALRFLTDHLNDDVYYGAAYPGHNFVRANNQLVLLERLVEKEKYLGDYLPGQ
jgi:Ser/Thr protein kinase RdoA (MazF antagonist)